MRDARQQQRADDELAVPADDRHQHQRGRDAAEERRERQRVDAERLACTGAAMPLPSAMVATAASAAPDDTPIRPGSASGLRNMPCIMAPETASAAPTNTPSSSARQADVEQHQLLAHAGGIVLARRAMAASTRGSEASVMPVGPMDSDRKAATSSGSAETATSTCALARRPPLADRRGDRAARPSFDGARCGRRRAAELGIELPHQLAGGVRRARAEAQQIQAHPSR